MDLFRPTRQNDSYLTKTSRVYKTLGEEIIRGRHTPGKRLIRRDLVKRFGVSLAVVNETLARLVTDGLAETKEMYGTRIPDLSWETVRNDLMIRVAIERQVARLLSENCDQRVLSSILVDAVELDRHQAKRDPQDETGMRLHLEFHLELARATGYTSLEETLYRVWVRHLFSVSWLSSVLQPVPKDWHQQLVKVIMVGNPDLADEKMRDHVRYGFESGSESLDKIKQELESNRLSSATDLNECGQHLFPAPASASGTSCYDRLVDPGRPSRHRGSAGQRRV